MKKAFRVAVIGCGAISATHVSAIRQSGQTICALCDTVPEHARALADRFGLQVPVYSGFTELLDREHPDAVHICTPHYLHASMCLEALGRNIHVLCEKPLCISEAELAELLRAEQNSSATLGVCLQNRYEPNMLRLKELSRAGTAGGMGIVNWNRGEAYYRSGEWRGKWATEGGGVMINQALHTLDLLQWICGMPAYVTAHCSNDHLRNVIEVEDTATAILETSDGRVLNFFATTAGGQNFPAQLQIALSDGKTVYADNRMLIGDSEILPNQPHGVMIGKDEWGRGHSALISDFYRCLAEQVPFPIPAAEGGKVIRLILAMYRSNGTRVKVSEPSQTGGDFTAPNRKE